MRSNPPTARSAGGGISVGGILTYASGTSDGSTTQASISSTANSISTAMSEMTRQNGTSLRYFSGEQGKRAHFYRNGDQFFKGLWYTISAFRSWDSLLEDLNQHLGDSIALPHGVRFIFTVDGILRFSLDELEHGTSYVCSSTEKFKAIDYANASQPMWSFVSSQRSAPPSRGGIRICCEKEPNDFVKPRIITIIRNGLKPRRVVRHLLNKRTAQSFEHVMQDITAIVKLNSGVVRKLYALSGKQVNCLADFFDEDFVFVAYGPEKVSVDDFYVISEEYKRMNIRGGIDGKKRIGPAGRCEMPVRNDGFRRTLSPVPKSKMAQAMKLPSELSDRIKIMDLLGDGNTALVFKALFRYQPSTSNETGQMTPMSGRSASPDALKIISKESAEENPDFVEMEIKLLSEVKHEYIVEMKEYHVFDNSWYIRMELMEEGDLFEYLTQERSLNEPNAASCVSCLCKALDYLHTRNIIHRDVKPENLLIYKCQDTGLLKLKLADFGLASKIKEDELLYHLCGTPTYVAPEVLAEFGYSYKADCWSVGIILYILLCGFPPFGMDEDVILFNKIIRGVFDFPSPSFDEISFAARLLVRRLLSTEPEARYSARDVINYFWIADPGQTTASLEETCMIELAEAMSTFSRQSNNDLEETDTEFFYSRRASMDEFSDHHRSENLDVSMRSNGAADMDDLESARSSSAASQFNGTHSASRNEDKNHHKRMKNASVCGEELNSTESNSFYRTAAEDPSIDFDTTTSFVDCINSH